MSAGTEGQRPRTIARETSTCRHCLGHGCVHCESRGFFSRRIYRVGTPREKAVLAWLRDAQPILSQNGGRP